MRRGGHVGFEQQAGCDLFEVVRAWFATCMCRLPRRQRASERAGEPAQPSSPASETSRSGRADHQAPPEANQAQVIKSICKYSAWLYLQRDSQLVNNRIIVVCSGRTVVLLVRWSLPALFDFAGTRSLGRLAPRDPWRRRAGGGKKEEALTTAPQLDPHGSCQALLKPRQTLSQVKSHSRKFEHSSRRCHCRKEEKPGALEIFSFSIVARGVRASVFSCTRHVSLALGELQSASLGIPG